MLQNSLNEVTILQSAFFCHISSSPVFDQIEGSTVITGGFTVRVTVVCGAYDLV